MRPPPTGPAALLRKAAALYPDNEAVICGEQRQTFRELLARSSRLANGLAGLGIEPGDRVALLGDNGLETMEQIGGLALGGYVRCGLYVHETPDINVYLLNLTGAAALIVQAKYWDAIAPHLDQVSSLRRVMVYDGDPVEGGEAYEPLLAQGSPDPPAPAIDEDSPHVIRFSAGTTGKPKAICHSVRAWSDMSTEAALPFPQFEASDRYLAAAPMTHAAGLFVWPFVAAGSAIVVMPAFDPAGLLELIERERVTVTMMVPVMAQILLAVPGVEDRDLSSLRAIPYGAAPMPESTLVRAIEVWGNIMYQVYGQSEALPLTILSPAHHVLDGTDRERELIQSAGRPTQNSMIRIVDDDGNDMLRGEVGEIAARGPGQMTMIWGDPEATAARFTDDGWLLTRDMGYLSEDGFLFLTGRKDDMIISGGFNIWPAELENALIGHPAVRDAAVVGVPDDKWGETPHAIVILAEGEAAEEDELIEWTRERVGSTKKPSAVHFATELPRTPIGKVLRRAVREQHCADHS